MPVVKRITTEEVKNARIFQPGTLLSYDQLNQAKDVWINPSGKVYYAGYWGHEESAKILGFESVCAAEKAGWVHVSSVLNGMPQFVSIPPRPSKAQRESAYDFCMAHTMHIPSALELS